MLGEREYVSIVNALTEHDKRQQGKKGYNPYALGHYMWALANIRDRMSEGLTLREAIIRSFCGRLCDIVLKSVGLPKAEKGEGR